MARREPGRITRVRPADDDNQVITIEGGRSGYRRRPCGGCPWVVANTGDFPPKAFEHSAETAYDASFHTFACHEHGAENTMVCAGFLLRGADHNLAIRLAAANGKISPDEVHEDGRELHESYRAMAVANGVDPDHPRLKECRP